MFISPYLSDLFYFDTTYFLSFNFTVNAMQSFELTLLTS